MFNRIIKLFKSQGSSLMLDPSSLKFKAYKTILKAYLLLSLSLHLTPLNVQADDVEPGIDFVGLYADAIHPTLGYMPPTRPTSPRV